MRKGKPNPTLLVAAWVGSLQASPAPLPHAGWGAAGALWEHVAPPPPMGLESVLEPVSLLRVPLFMGGLVEG